MTRALVVGGSGQIGGHLLRELDDAEIEAVGTFATVPTEGLVPLDASDFGAVERVVRLARPDLVFYPAGFTWVDGCEREPKKAQDANVDWPLNVARAALAAGAKTFVYFSTDYVFDGSSGPNGEEVAPAPLSEYGRSKWAAERALVAELGERALVLRTSWVYGPEHQGKNFAYQLVRSLRAGSPVVCPSDQRSSPSYAPDVARAALALAKHGAHGTFHVAGPRTVSRPEFARAIANAFGLDESLIAVKTTAELGQPAPRPLKGGLRTEKFQGLFPGTMRDLDEALADLVANASSWRGPLI